MNILNPADRQVFSLFAIGHRGPQARVYSRNADKKRPPERRPAGLRLGGYFRLLDDQFSLKIQVHFGPAVTFVEIIPDVA